MNEDNSEGVTPQEKDIYGKNIKSNPPGVDAISDTSSPDYADRTRRILQPTSERAPYMPGEVSWERLRQLREQYATEFKTKYADVLEDQEMELVLDMYFGPASLGADNIRREYFTNAPQENRRAIASLMALQMHSVYAVSQPETPDTYVNAVHDSIVILRNLARSEVGSVKGISPYYQGLRAGEAIIKTFADRGWDVVLPDYAQDVLNLPDEWKDRDEVMEWDVKSGVDFFVSDQTGNVILVDSKGQRAERRAREGEDPAAILTNPIITIHQEPNWVNALPDVLVQALNAHSPNNVFRSTIIVPSDDVHYFDFNLRAGEQYNKRREIQKFGRFVDPEMGEKIVQSVRSEIDKTTAQ